MIVKLVAAFVALSIIAKLVTVTMAHFAIAEFVALVILVIWGAWMMEDGRPL